MNLNAFRLFRLHRQFRVPRAHSSTTASVTHPASLPTVLIASPSPAAIAEQDEIQTISPEQVNIGLTQRAAEVRFSSISYRTTLIIPFHGHTKQLRQISLRENNPDAALRIAVESGGCHGYQYKMDLATRREPDD